MKKFLWVIICILLISCESDDDYAGINTSDKMIEMEGEGGEMEIKLNSGDWSIASVIGKESGSEINGNIYTLEGDLIKNNTALELEGLGEIEAIWDDKGFSIVRENPSSLVLHLKENLTDTSFNFVIRISSTQDIAEVSVIQKKSQGYSFNGIEYDLNEISEDSIFTKRAASFAFDLVESQQFSFNPYNGADFHNKVRFKSNINNLFAFLKEDSLLVQIPVKDEIGDINFSQEGKYLSDSWAIDTTGFNDKLETLTLPSGNSKFDVNLEYIKTIIPYTLQLINNRTGDKKIIGGELIKIEATGEYSIIWED